MPWLLLGLLAGTGALYFAANRERALLRPGYVELTFKQPVNASILRTLFDDVQDIDGDQKHYKVKVLTEGEFNLPGLTGIRAA